jgi:ATP-dependent 26S proteasome regulatory subunit
LSDILQLFDGIVKGIDLIIVMTTNNIEILDDALIREGRITKRIHMTKMKTIEINKMIKYYFDDVVELNFIENTITPAKLENLCIGSLNFSVLKEKMFKYIIID